MAKLKTKPNDQNVIKYFESIQDEKKRKDSFKLLNIMKEVTKEEPKMWGESIIGFGTYHFKYESGREGDWFLTGFSLRKQNFSIYIISGLNDFGELLSHLGKHRIGNSCLYIKSLDDIDIKVLKMLIENSLIKMSLPKDSKKN